MPIAPSATARKVKATVRTRAWARLRPADLTTLAQRNGGWFPFARVYEVIDGRRLVKAHGSREMPVWGLATGPKPLEYYAQAPANAEAHVRDRILALTEYVYRLQVK